MAKTMEPGKLLLGALYSYRTNGNDDRLDLIERILVEMGSKADKYLWMLSDIEQDLSKEMIDDVIKRLEVEQAPKSKGERMDSKLGQIAKKTIEPITSHPKSSTGANSYCLFCKQFYPTSKPIADFKCVHCSPTEERSAFPSQPLIPKTASPAARRPTSTATPSMSIHRTICARSAKAFQGKTRSLSLSSSTIEIFPIGRDTSGITASSSTMGSLGFLNARSAASSIRSL